jgi:hypothetical protein
MGSVKLMILGFMMSGNQLSQIILPLPLRLRILLLKGRGREGGL